MVDCTSDGKYVATEVIKAQFDDNKMEKKRVYRYHAMDAQNNHAHELLIMIIFQQRRIIVEVRSQSEFQ